MSTTVDLTNPDLSLTGLSRHAARLGLCTRRQALAALAGALAVGAVSVVRPEDPPRHRITRGRGLWTSTGSIAILAAHLALHDRAHAHSAAAPASGLRTHAWPNVVTFEVELHNGLDRAVLASPGQLRLQVGTGGMTVSPLAAGFAAGPQAAGSTLLTSVSYLAPSGARDLVLQYSELGAGPPLALVVPPLHVHGRVR